MSRTSQKLAGDEYIIKKFLDDLKSKLPFKKKLTNEEEGEYETEEEELEDIETTNTERTVAVKLSDLDEDEDDLEIEEEDIDETEDRTEAAISIKDKILNVINQLKAGGKAKTSVSSEDATQANVKKPNNRTKQLIQAAVVLGIVFMLFDEFTKEENVDHTPPPQVESDAGDNPESAPQDDSTPVADTPSESTPSDTTGMSESDMGLNEATIDEPSPSEPAQPDTSVSDSSFPDSSTTTETPSEDFTQTPSEPEPEPAQPDYSSDTSGSSLSDSMGDLSSPIDDQDSGDLTEKILQDLENQTKTKVSETPAQYVAPPDYEYTGRGLVYNCKALHWACVDGPSYKTCEDNFNFQKSKSAKPECYPFNVYENSRGCANMQNRMVSAGSKTEFCSGN